jgi:hypothetical protein
MRQKLIDGLLWDFDVSLPHLECDGFTRIATYTLRQNGISHSCFKGKCQVGEKAVEPHFWIVAGKYIVDYRLRMWAGEDAPHGVFESKDHPGVVYDGEEIELPVSSVIYDILTQVK